MGYLDCNGDGQTDTAAGVTPEIQQDLVAAGEQSGQAALMALPGSTRAFKEGAGAVRRAISCFNSFEEGTLVSTPDGMMPIEQILIGDYVLAYNEATGEIDAYPVTDLISHIDMEVVYLRIDGEMIVTTDEHPFYTSNDEWVDAGDLVVGDEIRQLNWETGTVEAVYTVTQPQSMYNFTVGTAHTYFVGDEQWLVHNSGPCNILVGGVNFRNYDGLIEAGKKTPGFIKREHHWIPRATHKRLKGLYPNLTYSDLNFIEAIDHGFHQYLHGKGAKGTLQEAYNGQLTRWLDNNPNATQTEFLNEVSRLREEYMSLYDSYLLQ